MTLPMSSADINIFQRKPATFVKSRNTDMHSFLQVVSNSFNFFFLVLKGCFNKHGCNFDDVAKFG